VGVNAEPVVKEWRIQCINVITGPYAFFGEAIAFTMDQAVKDINNAGGIAGKPVAIDYYDEAMDPAKTVTELNKFIDKSLVIIGPISANVSPAAMPIYTRHKAFAIPPFLSPFVAEQYQPWMITGIPPMQKMPILPIKEWLKRNPGMKTVVQFTWPLDPLWIAEANSQRAVMEEAGIKVFDVECSAGVDMGSAVVKAMDRKPEGYTINVGPVETAKIVKELDKRGVKDKGKIIIFANADDAALFELGAGYLDGCYNWGSKDNNSSSPRWQSLKKRYIAKYPGSRSISAVVPICYDMVYLVKLAIENTGATGNAAKLQEERAKLMSYSRNIKNFPGVLYDYDFVNGFPQWRVYLLQVKNNELIRVEEYLNLKW
jgi:branched-chain amino acid transport system substrate-binding protein